MGRSASRKRERERGINGKLIHFDFDRFGSSHTIEHKIMLAISHPIHCYITPMTHAWKMQSESNVHGPMTQSMHVVSHSVEPFAVHQCGRSIRLQMMCYAFHAISIRWDVLDWNSFHISCNRTRARILCFLSCCKASASPAQAQQWGVSFQAWILHE